MQCKHQKESGEQCGGNAMTGADYCYTHNPEISQEEKREAKAKGGSNRAVGLKKALPELQIKKMPDVALLLVDTIQRVRAGEMDIRVANCLGVLSGQLMKALEITDLESRMEQLEALINDKTTR